MARRDVTLAGGIAALFLVHAWFLAGVSEDAFITFRFARHWADGHGLVWNLGEPPVEGYTNFLWLALMALASRLGAPLPEVSQLLGVAAGVAAGIYTARAARESFGLASPGCWLPVSFLALAGPFATWSAGGLETSLFTALLVAAFFHLARWLGAVRRGGTGRDADLVWMGAALLLAMLTRPEGVLVSGLWLALAWCWSAGAMRRRAALVAAVAGGLYLAYFAWRLHVFGDWLPNTFYAKTSASFSQVERGFAYLGYFALHYVLPWAPLLSLALASWWRAGGGFSAWSWRRPRPERVAPMLSWSLLGVYAAYLAAVGGDYMAMYRFVVPLLPFLYLVFAAGAAEVLSRGGGALSVRRRLAWLWLAVAAAGTAIHSTPLEQQLFAKPKRMHGNYRGVQTERWHVARLETLGRFFADYAAGPGESVATRGIGGIGYYSELAVYDLYGVVDRHIARQGGAELGGGLPGHERGDLLYVFGRRPTFFMNDRDLSPRPAQHAPHFGPALDPLVARDYVLKSVWLEDVDNQQAGYFNFLERRDRSAQ